MSKYLKKRERKSFRISLRPLCAFVVWLMLFSLMSTGVTYAKYQSDATATATATVAKFNVTVSIGDPNGSTLVIGEEDSVSCTVTFADNDTEILVDHKIVVSKVPDGVVVSIPNITPTVTTTNEGNIFTFNLGTSIQNESFVLTFIAGDEAEEDADVNVVVTATAEQAVL